VRRLGEKADRDKPTQIEANRLSADDTRRMNIFEGNVVLTKGTILVRAERIVVRQDAELSILTHRQPGALPPAAGPEGRQGRRWVDGEALRIEIDDRNSKIELFENCARQPRRRRGRGQLHPGRTSARFLLGERQRARAASACAP